MWPFNKPKLYTLCIYMKSGNVIELDRITGYTFESNINTGKLTSISLSWHKPKHERLLVKTIDIDQIKAVTMK